MTAAVWCWAFEARSIQDYLFATGRLADAVGASLLVDRLTGDLTDDPNSPPANPDLLSAVLKAACVEDQVTFSRRAGGSFIAFADSQDTLVRARLLWHSALHTNAPGLRWSDGIASAETHQKAAGEALRRAQQAGQFDPARLPEAAPVHTRVPRTGEPAQALSRLGAKGKEPVDSATVARRRHRHHASNTLTRRFEGTRGPWKWPTDLSVQAADGDDADVDIGTEGRWRFPFLGSNQDVAFIHADGNGLGVLLGKLGSGRYEHNDYVDIYAGFSKAISIATQEAAALATQQVLEPAITSNGIVPARPLVLGGDDLQVIVRADLAVPFVEAFLKAFEAESAKALHGLRHVLGLPEGKGLTAAAGVLIAKANFPFAMAASQAGELCDRAKVEIKQEKLARKRSMPLSALALQRAHASLTDVSQKTLVGQQWQLGLPAYVVVDDHEDTALPRLQDLQALALALGDSAAPQGPARRLVADLHTNISLARERFRRMAEIQGDQWNAVKRALQALGADHHPDLPFTQANASPWEDALLLRDLIHAAGPASTGRATDPTAPLVQERA